jgi:UDP-glucose 4-epimerase
MSGKRVVLVTGVANQWGSRVAASLLADPKYHVIGLDTRPPGVGFEGLDMIEADIRNPLLVELFQSESVHTVCHLKIIEQPHLSESAFDLNVMGTMKVFGACVQAGVSKIVFKSSTAVYGAGPRNSAFLDEQSPMMGSRKNGYTRDLVEIQAFCNGFRRQNPQVNLTILRFPNIIGPTASTPMTRYLSERMVPVLLGFDPIMQLIHEEDVIQSLVYCIKNDYDGEFNIAADGVTPLRKLIALAGKYPIPVLHWFAYWGSSLFGGVGEGGGSLNPYDVDYIRYPWVADTTRMRKIMGYVPEYTCEEALREFASRQRVSQINPDSTRMALDEERLRDTLERRRRSRERNSTIPEGQMEVIDEE